MEIVTLTDDFSQRDLFYIRIPAYVGGYSVGMGDRIPTYLTSCLQYVIIAANEYIHTTTFPIT